MRITDLNPLFTASLNNVLYIIDTNDTGSFFSGSSKKITVGDFLSSSGVVGNGTSSYSFNANTSSYSFTSSYALNSGTSLITGSNYPITSSWALRVISASISNTSSYISPTFISESAASSGFGTGGGSTTLVTGSTYPITSSWALNTFTASYSLTASYALNGSSGGGIYLSSESFFANGLSSSYTITSSVLESSEDIFVFINGLVQSPTTNYSLSSSILVFNGVPSTGSLIEVRRFDANISGSGGGGGGGTTLTTGSSYPITSSWAITASYALAGLVFGNIDGGNPSEIYSYNSNIDGGNP